MTGLGRLRSDVRAFSLAIEQPLAEWPADSLSLERRTTVLVAPTCPNSLSSNSSARTKPMAKASVYGENWSDES